MSALAPQPDELGCAELATIAMNDALGAYRRMSAPGAEPEPCMYLYRGGRLERHPLADLARSERKEWVIGGLLAALITAGRVEIAAVVHSGRTRRPLIRSAVFVHVFSAQTQESWHAAIHTRESHPPRLGAWHRGDGDVLSQRTRGAIRQAFEHEGRHAA